MKSSDRNDARMIRRETSLSPTAIDAAVMETTLARISDDDLSPLCRGLWDNTFEDDESDICIDRWLGIGKTS